MMGITGTGNRGWKPVQKGLREPLFCDDCEQLFNDRYEKPFLEAWVKNCPLPDQLEPEKWYSVSVPSYETFKLFHLSVFFRASVSTEATYREVDLGPHQEKFRQMLMSGDPGDYWQYLVIGYAVIHDKTYRLIPMIAQPQKRRFDGNMCFSMLYAGVEWWITVLSHRTKDLEEVALRTNGRMPLLAVPWNSIPVIQAGSAALRGST